MPRMYFRHPVTQAMIPLTLGGSAGGNEVTVASVAPTDGTDLWMDLTSNTLKYRDPTTGNYLAVTTEGGGGGSMTDGTIVAGSGLTGGGKQSTSPTLNVGAGYGITVASDSVAVNTGTLNTLYAPINGHAAVTITDWNSAVLNNTNYMASGAANAPDSGWFYGYTVSHNSSWKSQYLSPFANARWSTEMVWYRHQENGAWQDWNRSTSYLFSRDTLDGGTFAQHNASSASDGVRRCFWGMVKDKNTANASNSDCWRVTYYNTAGSYLGQAISIPLGTGVVSHPAGHSRTISALRTRSPIQADTAATVGVVMEIVAAALASAGIDLNPTAVARLVEEQQE